ncbi:placenta growth factor [Rhea pennata]|uniref:placenta growth factor n=1 Tax=Rhea pennata TaxID=8795 RepID=UPI002E26AA9D
MAAQPIGAGRAAAGPRLSRAEPRAEPAARGSAGSRGSGQLLALRPRVPEPPQPAVPRSGEADAGLGWLGGTAVERHLVVVSLQPLPGPAAPFRDVWNRSFCRPLEQLVDVAAEFPGEVQDVFRPSCVALQRCGGCCGDEGLRCVPLESRTLRVQLLRIKPSGEAPYVEMAFTEHKRCACRPRQDPMKAGRRRSKGRGKRRQNKKRRKDCALCGTPRR